MKKVDFVFFDAGGGHRSAATALKAVIEQQQRPWEVRLVNLQEVLAPLDIFRKMTGIRMEDIYNKLLKKGWTLGSEYLIPPMHWIIRMYHSGQVRMLTEFWKRDTPDMVVSVIPNFGRALYQSINAAAPNTPLVTILTDLADYPPHFWTEPNQHRQYYICGSERAEQQVLGMGHPRDRVLLTSGMILRPVFYQQISVDRGAEREKLRLERDLPTGIVLFGGQGSSTMLRIVHRLQESSQNLQLILICGKNEKLAARLRAIKSRIPLHVVGFTSEVPYYMYLSDFFIGKPGPGSLSEALALHLPVIVERNSWTLPQERFNTEWVKDKGVGVVLHSFDEIGKAVEEMLAPGKLEQYRANARSISNRAIFEIPEFLDQIMGGHK